MNTESRAPLHARVRRRCYGPVKSLRILAFISFLISSVLSHRLGYREMLKQYTALRVRT
jgi:hypothetical protein